MMPNSEIAPSQAVAGRTPRGLFAPGNRFGRGGQGIQRRRAVLQAVLLRCVTRDDVRDIFAQLMDIVKTDNGDQTSTWTFADGTVQIRCNDCSTTSTYVNGITCAWRYWDIVFLSISASASARDSR